MAPRELSLQRSALRLLAWVSLALLALFAAQLGMDLWAAGRSLADLSLSSAQAQALASSVSRALNNLLAMVLAFIALAVPLTANMYTPRLIEIFMTDRINLAALLFYALMAANAIFVQGLPAVTAAPTAQYAVIWTSGVIGFAVLVPYYFYVLGFLDPDTIIARIGARIAREYASFAEGVVDMDGAQRRLHARILHLGNVALRAIDRNDRDVALSSLRAMRRAVTQYAHVKETCPAAWFQAPQELFVGMSREAVELVSRERVWVEHRALGQLLLAYNAALGRMQDAVSVISDATREIALQAREDGDVALVTLAVRYFNTFVRSAIGRRDLHAMNDAFYQYRRLACELLADRPDLGLRVAKHVKYYADFARHERVPYAYELAAYELAAVVEAAYAAGSSVREELLRLFLTFDAEGATVRLTTAKAVLAGFFAESGRTEELALVSAALARAPDEHLEAARRNLTETTDPVFWEITARQRNLDYVEPPRREAIALVLDQVLRRGK